PRDAARAIGPDSVEADGEGVAGLRALDVERTGHRVAPVGEVLVVAVVAARIDAPRADRVAGRNAEDGLVRSYREVERGRLELVNHRASTSSRSLSPRPDRQTSTSSSSSSARRASAW